MQINQTQISFGAIRGMARENNKSGGFDIINIPDGGDPLTITGNGDKDVFLSSNPGKAYKSVHLFSVNHKNELNIKGNANVDIDELNDAHLNVKDNANAHLQKCTNGLINLFNNAGLKIETMYKSLVDLKDSSTAKIKTCDKSTIGQFENSATDIQFMYNSSVDLNGKSTMNIKSASSEHNRYSAIMMEDEAYLNGANIDVIVDMKSKSSAKIGHLDSKNGHLIQSGDSFSDVDYVGNLSSVTLQAGAKAKIQKMKGFLNQSQSTESNVDELLPKGLLYNCDRAKATIGTVHSNSHIRRLNPEAEINITKDKR